MSSVSWGFNSCSSNSRPYALKPSPCLPIACMLYLICVHRHRWTGKWEAHLWDAHAARKNAGSGGRTRGKQVGNDAAKQEKAVSQKLLSWPHWQRYQTIPPPCHPPTHPIQPINLPIQMLLLQCAFLCVCQL